MANQLFDPDNPARASDGTLRSVEEMETLGVEFPYSPSSVTNLLDSKQPHRIESSSKLTDTRLRCNLTSENFGAIQMAKSSLKKQHACEAREAVELEEEHREQWLAQEAEERARRAKEAGVTM